MKMMNSNQRNRSGGSSIGGRAFAVPISLFAALLLTACQPTITSQGQKRDVLAAYQFRTLEAKLGPEVQILTAKAAAEQAVRSRGYVVMSSEGSNDKARVVAKNSGSGDWDKLVIEAWVADRATLVSVTCEPWGDEAVSRAVLDAMLNRLGR